MMNNKIDNKEEFYKNNKDYPKDEWFTEIDFYEKNNKIIKIKCNIAAYNNYNENMRMVYQVVLDKIKDNEINSKNYKNVLNLIKKVKEDLYNTTNVLDEVEL